MKYGKRIMLILSFGKMFADHDVFLYTILDPDRRRREFRRYLLMHPNDYYIFSIKRKRLMMLKTPSKISPEELAQMYYAIQLVEKAFSYSRDDISLLPLGGAWKGHA